MRKPPVHCIRRGRCSGVLQQEPSAWFRGGADTARIVSAIAERPKARRARDFARADAIRAELASEGIVLEDGRRGRPGGANPDFGLGFIDGIG
jgi:cysteinyl-tRNA synthetase